MSDRDPDAAPSPGLERAFRLPAMIREDPELVALYEEAVERLEAEAKGIPMNTVQRLLMERLATFYVTIKYREDTDSWAGASQQKDFNTYWLSLTSEFNTILQKNDDSLRQAMLLEIQTVVMESVKLIKDSDDRRSVMRSLSENLAEIGR